MLQYVSGTLKIARIISIEDFDDMHIFIDAAHGTHRDMRGQTGGCVRFGLGVVNCRSNKQNLNSKSSTETELIGNSDYLPYPIWLVYFMGHRGYDVKRKLLHQDNQSMIGMLKNGKKSCGKQSRNLNLRIFWTTDKLRELGIDVVYCRTELMLGDFFTKPLQGNLFRRMRDVVMGAGSYDEDLMVKYEINKEMEVAGLVNNENSMKLNECDKKNKPKVILMTNRKERVGNRERRVSFSDGVKSVNERNELENTQRAMSYVEAVRRNIR